MIKLKSLLIVENYQLALKLYKNSLTPEDIEFLSILSGRDYTFKTLADLLMEEKENVGSLKWNKTQWNEALSQLQTYNKNVFPIKNFSFDSPKKIVTKQLMRNRQKVIEIVSTWPSIAKRNLKGDIKIPRDSFYKLHNTVEYINVHLQLLDNRTDELKSEIYNKIFSSDHNTFDAVIDFVEDKVNLLSGKAYTKEELYKLVNQNDYDLKIIYDKGNIVIVDVTGQPGIKTIGCNSLWCFTYGNEYGKAGEFWDQYSYNGHVYAIIDFGRSQNEPEFIHILTKPFHAQEYGEDRNFLYNMANEEATGDRAENRINDITGDPRALHLFTFDDVL